MGVFKAYFLGLAGRIFNLGHPVCWLRFQHKSLTSLRFPIVSAGWELGVGSLSPLSVLLWQYPPPGIFLPHGGWQSPVGGNNVYDFQEYCLKCHHHIFHTRYIRDKLLWPVGLLQLDSVAWFARGSCMQPARLGQWPTLVNTQGQTRLRHACYVTLAGQRVAAASQPAGWYI